MTDIQKARAIHENEMEWLRRKAQQREYDMTPRLGGCPTAGAL